jgi:hypothetical protein
MWEICRESDGLKMKTSAEEEGKNLFNSGASQACMQLCPLADVPSARKIFLDPLLTRLFIPPRTH